jgi:hypothetical protein
MNDKELIKLMSDIRLKYLSGSSKVQFRILEERFKELYLANETLGEFKNINDLRDEALQYFTDLSRGKLFEYNGVKIFYNNEYETFSLNHEQNVVSITTVWNIINDFKLLSEVE